MNRFRFSKKLKPEEEQLVILKAINDKLQYLLNDLDLILLELKGKSLSDRHKGSIS